MGKSWGGGVGWRGSSPGPPARGMGGSEPGRARGARRRWSRRRVLGRTRRDAGSGRPPPPAPFRAAPSRPSNSRGAAWPGGVGPSRREISVCEELAAGRELGSRSEVEFMGSGLLGRRGGLRAPPRSCRSGPGLVTVVKELPIGWAPSGGGGGLKPRGERVGRPSAGVPDSLAGPTRWAPPPWGRPTHGPCSAVPASLPCAGRLVDPSPGSAFSHSGLCTFLPLWHLGRGAALARGMGEFAGSPVTHPPAVLLLPLSYSRQH